MVVSSKHKFYRQNCFKHFRSEMHCNSASAKNRAGGSLHEGVLHDREMHVFAQDLPQSIVDDAIISCAKKSLSFTSVPVVLDVVTRALNSCRGKDVLSNDEMMNIRKRGGSDYAYSCTRCNCFCEHARGTSIGL